MNTVTTFSIAMNDDLALQVWCQASEEDQAAGIAIVTACMESAQDVSLT